ncbi:MAG TPA: hypothetical protein VF662_05540 [Allosphingosinicella sp.]
MPRPFKRSQAAQNRRFLRALERTGNVRLAARELGVHRGTYTKRRARCPAFAAQWEAALAASQANLHRSGRACALEIPPRNGEGDRLSGGGGAGRRPVDSLRPLRTRGGEPTLVHLKNGRLQLREALPGRMTAETIEAFLETLEDTANIRLAAEAAGVAHSSILARARRDPGFAAIVAATVAEASARLPAAAAALTAEIAREVEAGRDERPHWPPGLTVAQALHALRGRR